MQPLSIVHRWNNYIHQADHVQTFSWCKNALFWESCPWHTNSFSSSVVIHSVFFQSFCKKFCLKLLGQQQKCVWFLLQARSASAYISYVSVAWNESYAVKLDLVTIFAGLCVIVGEYSEANAMMTKKYILDFLVLNQGIWMWKTSNELWFNNKFLWVSSELLVLCFCT